MRLLLDTHVLLWSLSQPKKLGSKTRALMSRREIYVSAASFWELAIKQSLGRLKADLEEMLDAVPQAGFELLPVAAAHAIGVAQLPAVHQDPFDRLLVAQARHEGLTLLTADETLQAYGPTVRLV